MTTKTMTMMMAMATSSSPVMVVTVLSTYAGIVIKLKFFWNSFASKKFFHMHADQICWCVCVCAYDGDEQLVATLYHIPHKKSTVNEYVLADIFSCRRSWLFSFGVRVCVWVRVLGGSEFDPSARS